MKEEFEDTKVVIRIHILKKDRQHNDQRKRDTRTHKDLPNITQKTKDRVTQTPLKPGMYPGCPEERAIPALLVVPVAFL